MSNKKKLVFNVGDHKAGSTSIQTAFYKKSVCVPGKNVFYPNGLSINNYGARFLNHQRESLSENAWIETQQDLKKMAQDIKRSEADFIIFSGENFEPVYPRLVKRVIDTTFRDIADPIIYVTYLRPHAARFVSSFSERTKIGVSAVLSETLESSFAGVKKRGGYRFFNRLQRWKNAFGERYIVRPVIRSELVDSSVLNDFAAIAFGENAFEIESTKEENKSVCVQDLVRLKVLHSWLNLDPKLSHHVGWLVHQTLSTLPPVKSPVKLSLHKDLAEDIRKHCLEDAQLIDENIFDKKPLMVTELEKAVDTASSKPVSLDPNDYLAKDEMRSLQLMAEFIRKLVRTNGQNWKQVLYEARLQDL